MLLIPQGLRNRSFPHGEERQVGQGLHTFAPSPPQGKSTRGPKAAGP